MIASQDLNFFLRLPLLIFVFSLSILWLSVQAGDFVRQRLRPPQEDERRDLDLVTGAALTLLGLIIGFSFSLASSRYEQRKDYEEEEANAIGTEYLRLGLLPATDSVKVRKLLRQYLDERILFYSSRNKYALAKIDRDTSKLQMEMWTIVQNAAAAQPSPVVALVASGMNDVLNTQGYTQAAWWNRIPEGAWVLMMILAIGSSLLIGYGSHHRGRGFLAVLPVLFSFAFFLIADIDAPRHGLIRVQPRNLLALSQSLQQQ